MRTLFAIRTPVLGDKTSSYHCENRSAGPTLQHHSNGRNTASLNGLILLLLPCSVTKRILAINTEGRRSVIRLDRLDYLKRFYKWLTAILMLSGISEVGLLVHMCIFHWQSRLKNNKIKPQNKTVWISIPG